MAMLPDSATTEAEASGVPLVKEIGALRDNGGGKEHPVNGGIDM